MDVIIVSAEILANVAECAICVYFLVKYFTVRKENSYIPTLICFTFLLLDNILLSQRIGYELMSVIIFFMTMLLFAVILLKGMWVEKFVYCGILLIAIVLINVLVTDITAVIIGMSIEDAQLLHDSSYSLEIRIITLFSTKILFFLVVNILLAMKKRMKYIFLASEWVLMLVLFCVSLFICMSLWVVNRRYTDMNPVIYVGSVLGLILINIALYILLHKLGRENIHKRELALLEMSVASQKELISEVKVQYEEIKIIRHDIKNCLQTAKLLLEEDKIDEAKRYLQKLAQNQFNRIVPLACTKSNVLNAVFNLKMTHCVQLKIDFLYDVTDTCPTEMELDLSILLSNLLDNAIEASKNVETNKVIMASIIEGESSMGLMVKNHIDSSVLDINPNLHTTKSDKIQHGYGIKSIQKIVGKYSGTREVYEKDTFFVVEVELKRK